MVCASLAASAASGESMHSHPAPEKLGDVHFATSCAAGVQSQFERAVALLHSFAYEAASEQFHAVATHDKECAMAHWGVAMSGFHQLWSPPPGADDLRLGREEIVVAQRSGARTERERQLIDAAGSDLRVFAEWTRSRCGAGRPTIAHLGSIADEGLQSWICGDCDARSSRSRTGAMERCVGSPAVTVAAIRAADAAAAAAFRKQLAR